jgi:hypothetical protein
MNTQINNENSKSNLNFLSTCLASCEKLVGQIERAKSNIIAEFHDAFETHEQLLNRAIGEANALAWQTAYPHLLFPLLATEKVQAAAQWNARQQFLRQRNLTNSFHPVSI